MNAGNFLANFGHIANAPGGVQRLRELVLQLAVTGKLVRRIAGDDEADALLAKIAQERRRLVDVAEIKRGSPLPEVDSSSPLPAVPDHWRWIRLGNLTSKIGSGSTPRGGAKVYTRTGVPFLRSQNIWNDGIRLDDVVFIDKQTHEAMGNTHVLPNDILLNITGASLGRCAIVPSSFAPANVSQHVTIVRPLLADTRRFLRVCLLSPFGQGMIWGRQVGMAREGLSKKVLEQFEIPVPPLKEQRRIVERMDELMALCDLLEGQQQERARHFPVLSHTCHARFIEAPTKVNLNRIFDGIGAVSPSDFRKTILTLAVQGKLVSQDPNDEPAKELIARLSREMSQSARRQLPPLAPMVSTQHELPASWAWAHFQDVAIIASNLVNPNDYLDFTHLAPDNIEKGTGVLLPCSTARFFKYLESTYISDLIDEVRINVKHRTADGNMNFTQLSEGEQQLLTVLGLMRFTHEDESLFLLDEPDTHLNPIWKLRYFDEIEKVVKLQDESATGDSQLIITTHDPLMIGSLRKEQVRILKCDGGKATVETPDENPQGMGFAGLLKSELFGLRSTVDTETLRRLDQRNYLYALGKKRKKAQDEQLTQLSAELAELGFASDFKDPYFALFVQKMALHTEFHKPVLTPKEREQQDKAATSIVNAILAKEKKA